MTDRRWSDVVVAWAVLLAAFALLLVPGTTGGVVDSAPLSLAGKGLLASLVTTAVAAWVLGIGQVSLRPVALLGVLVAAKLLLGAFDAPLGWRTQVYMDGANEPASFFWRYAEHASRIDPAIDFDGSEVGFHFLNDLVYNTGAYVEGRREDVRPFRAVWQAEIHAPAGSAVTGKISARGNTEVRTAAGPVLVADDPEGAAFTVRVGDTGTAAVEVVYRKPAQVEPFVRLTWANGPAPRVVPPSGRGTASKGQELRAAVTSTIVAGGALYASAVILLSTWRARASSGQASAVGGVAVVVAFGIVAIGAILLSDRFAGHIYFMSSGNDPIVYEGSARDIMANGPLMLSGRPLGQAPPYFHYPLYPYVVAAFHWGIGEDAAAVMLGNGLLVGLTIPLIWTLGWRCLHGWSAVAAVAAATWLTGRHALPYAQEVFTDNLFLPLVLTALLAGTRAMQTDRWGHWVLTGSLIALGAAARPSLLTYLPFLMAALTWMGWRRSRWSWAMRACLLTSAGFALGVAPFTLRNYYVSGQLVMLVNSWVGLAVFLVPPGESYAFIYSGRALTLVESVGQAVRLIAEHPARSAELELRKLFFALGVTQLGPGPALIPSFLCTSVAACAALFRGRIPESTLLVTGAFAVSHVVAMVMAAPWTYGYKSILPLQAVFLLWAGCLAPGGRKQII